MRNIPLIAVLFLGTAACSAGMAGQAAGPGTPAAESSRDSAEARGLAFAQQNCAGCHAVTAGGSSPNVDAPPFEAVANTPGLTDATIKPWLLDSHNFPDMMNFVIAPDQVDDLSAYMLKLQRNNYVPAI